MHHHIRNFWRRAAGAADAAEAGPADPGSAENRWWWWGGGGGLVQVPGALRQRHDPLGQLPVQVKHPPQPEMGRLFLRRRPRLQEPADQRDRLGREPAAVIHSLESLFVEGPGELVSSTNPITLARADSSTSAAPPSAASASPVALASS